MQKSITGINFLLDTDKLVEIIQEIMKWPIYFKDNLIAGNIESNIAICTLWLKRDIVANEIDSQTYSVIGNLYSKDGINYLLRNIFANPKIRFIILAGFDRSESGKTLLNLKKYGIDENHVIKKSNFQLEKEIDISTIELFREKVELIDLIGKYRPDEIKQHISKLSNNLPPFIDKPLIFPEPEMIFETYPSEEKAIVVRGNLVAEVWIKLLNIILKFGQYDKTQYTVEQKEIIDIVSVISKEDPDNIYFPNWLPFKRMELEGGKKEDLIGQLSLDFGDFVGEKAYKGYYAQVLTAYSLPDLSYTYGQRLLKFEGINQIDDIISKLKQAKYSRRAVAILWNPVIDSKSENPPCLNLIQFRIAKDRLLMTAYFRSHDIYSAWPKNAFALRKLQNLIAVELNDVTLGELIIISHSAHIYGNNIDAAKEIVKMQYSKLEKRVSFEKDPRGSFAIRVENKEIIINHYSPDGKHIQTFLGKNAMELSIQIVSFVSLMSHAIYLGRELEKAKVALHTGVPYIQDEDIELGDITQQ